MKDPEFASQFEKLANDPSFMEQVNAMADSYEQEAAKETGGGTSISSAQPGAAPPDDQEQAQITKLKIIEVQAGTDRKTNFIEALPTIAADENTDDAKTATLASYTPDGTTMTIFLDGNPGEGFWFEIDQIIITAV